MAVIAVSALTLAWIRSQPSFGYALIVVSHSIVAWGLCLALAIVVARAFGPAVPARRVRVAVSGLLALALTASLYLAWAHHRAMYLYVHGLDQGFPYPDRAINALERWFDARSPVAPGMFKVHGEYPLVGFVLGVLVLGFSGLTGLLFGVLSNRRGDDLIKREESRQTLQSTPLRSGSCECPARDSRSDG
jgi:hypothetical protein